MTSRPGLIRHDFLKMTGTGLAGASLLGNTRTGLNWGQPTAAGTVALLPMLVVGLAVRRYLVRGLTLGAVTGD